MAETLQKSSLDSPRDGESTPFENGDQLDMGHEKVTVPRSRDEGHALAIQDAERRLRGGEELLSVDHFRTLLSAYGKNLDAMRAMKAENPEQQV